MPVHVYPKLFRGGYRICGRGGSNPGSTGRVASVGAFRDMRNPCECPGQLLYFKIGKLLRGIMHLYYHLGVY